MGNVWSVIQGAEWPLTILLIAIMQAKPIGRLLDRINALKAPGGFEAEMRQPMEPLALAPVAEIHEQTTTAFQIEVQAAQQRDNAELVEAYVSTVGELTQRTQERDQAYLERNLMNLYIRMFRSQMTMLIALYTKGRLTDAEVRPFYDDAVKRGYALDQDTWLQYLVGMMLVTREASANPYERPGLTPGAWLQPFLDFCLRNSLSPDGLLY